MPTKTMSYTQIVKQIAALQAEAERLRKKEAADVIARIRDAIKAYGLTAADLGLAGNKPGPKPKAMTMAGSAGPAGPAAAPIKRRRRRKGAAAKVAGPKVVKFKNDLGGTWGGRGKRPQWLRDALNSGKQLSDFAVK